MPREGVLCMLCRGFDRQIVSVLGCGAKTGRRCVMVGARSDRAISSGCSRHHCTSGGETIPPAVRENARSPGNTESLALPCPLYRTGMVRVVGARQTQTWTYRVGITSQDLPASSYSAVLEACAETTSHVGIVTTSMGRNTH
ncbi:hypothetical protein Q8A67_015320 [Cirrhinus molitorella]|uniref:Uncharacterized protein n=1 Tax=Cirrhinus molitorella TaxID=172907 RepID=A0AA88TTA4_9TELE|nr:hypothetical protein Q8A67_015320 [Cirrhinus molitorella]